MTKKGYVHPGDNYSDRYINNSNYNLFLRVARIIRVDHETMEIDVVYLDGIGAVPKIPITQPYMGPRGFLGAMPSINDWVLLGYAKSGSLSNPLVVGFFPSGYPQGNANDLIKVPKSAEGIDKETRYKMRKLYEGEIYSSSKYGSEIYLDKDVSISNSKLNEILLKSSDQSLHISTINAYLNTAGVRTLVGMAHRNSLLNDPEFQLPNKAYPTYTNEDGVRYYTPNLSSGINNDYPFGRETINDSNPAFIEHRIEVKEVENPILPVTFSNSGVDVDSFYKQRSDNSSDKPLVIQVLGTLIGNDPIGDRSKYGMILKPKIFHDPQSFKGTPSEVGCVSDEGNDETITLAAAYTLKFPNTATAFYINKQGKYFANIASSTSVDPMGSGESAEINLQGHTKMNMGKNRSKQRSFSMTTAGGIYTNWGFDNEKSRSWDATFRKGVSWNILGSDKDNVSWRMEVNGDVVHTITGSRFTEIKGDDIRLVHGTLEDRVLGRKVDNFVSDKATNYGGAYNETAIGHYSQVLASGRDVTIVSPDLLAGSIVADSLDVKFGDVKHKILIGNKSESILIGNHDTSILVGNKSTSIVVGNYSIDVKAGVIDIKTLAGSINIETVAGTVNIQGTLSVNIKSAVKVNLESPLVDIGGSPVRGGIVTSGPAGHRDYLTGLTLLGSTTVTCNSV